MERVIFSIDDWSNLRKLARFLRHMADQQAMGKLKGEFKTLQGSYKGIPEISFMCSKEDFMSFVVPYGWIVEQKSILYINKYNEAVLCFERGHEALGKWTQVSKWEKGDSWSYDPKDKTWWTCL